MPKDTIKKYLPHPDKIKENRFLKVFGPVIHDPQLWHITRHSVKRAFLIGLFFAFWPVPFQMVLAAGGAILIRANLPVSVALVWITNPVTMPFLFGFAYYVGLLFVGGESSTFEFELSWRWLELNLQAIWQPFLLGCAICAIVAAVVGYFAINAYWNIHVTNAWKKRQQLRQSRR